MGRRIRQPAQGTTPPGHNHSRHARHHSGATVHLVQFVWRRPGGHFRAAVWRSRRRSRPVGNTHIFQHLGRRRIRFGSGRSNVGWNRVRCRHSPRGSARARDQALDYPCFRGGDAPSVDGLSGGRPRVAASGALARNRRTGTAATSARGGGRNDHHLARDPDRGASDRQLGTRDARRVLTGQLPSTRIERTSEGAKKAVRNRLTYRKRLIHYALKRLTVLLVAIAVTTAAQAQQQSFTWEQIQGRFLATNPTLRAQAQSIESSRASEITAGLRPNPQFQNDTTSATLGIYQEFELGGKRTARLQSAHLATSISKTDFANARRTLVFNLRQAFVAALLAKSDLDFARDNLANYQKVVYLNRLTPQLRSNI